MISINYLIALFLSLQLPMSLQADQLMCLDVLVEVPRLQKSNNITKDSLKIERVERDKDGIWFVLNSKVSSSYYESNNFIGISRVVDGKSWMPHPTTMTQLLKKNRPGNPLSFVAHPDGVLRLDEYLVLIAEDKLPIGFDGLYLHDVLDHSLGYALLAETPAWSVLKKTIQLTIAAHTKSSGKAPTVRTFLAKINAFLEASTTALPGIFENKNKEEQKEEFQLIFRQLDRLHAKAIEISHSDYE